MSSDAGSVPAGSPLADIDKLVSFERDANTLLVGPTSSGKTTLLRRIVNEGLFSGGEPKRVYIVVPKETAEDWKSHTYKIKVTYIIGEDELDSFLKHGNDCPQNSIVIFDDFMSALDNTARRRDLEKWFFVTTHHRHLWTFFVTHDMFHRQLMTIRRNTQNFILFNVLSDTRSATEFAQRLLGPAAGTAFVAMWTAAVEDQDKGWIRLDQKLERSLPLKTIVSTGGLSVDDGVSLGARSESIDGPLYLDAMALANAAPNPLLAIPDSMIRSREHGSHQRPKETAGSMSDDGASDVQQSDGSESISSEH